MLVGEAYTVPPSDTIPAEPIGEPSPRMSIDAIQEIPSPANSLGAATAAQSSVVAMSPNDPSADSTNERGIQSSTPDWEMMSLLRCSAVLVETELVGMHERQPGAERCRDHQPGGAVD